MDARELRVGNYILDSVHINGGYVRQTESFHEMDEYLNLYSPIPLTEEWLVKFGMDSLDMEIDYVEWGFDNGEKFHIIQDGIGNEFPFYFEYDLGFGNNRIEIKYVHQLQNLFYCLTGNELELKEEVKK